MMKRERKMKRNRMRAAAVLTAGLSVTGMVAGSASGATTPSASHDKASARSVAVAAGQGGHSGHHNPPVICFIQKAPKGTKPPKLPAPPKGGATLPGLPGLPPLSGKPSSRQHPKTVITVVNGKVFINGKPAPKGTVNTNCPKLPPLPPPPGKGGKGPVVGGVIIKGGGGSTAAWGQGGGSATVASGTSASTVEG